MNEIKEYTEKMFDDIKHIDEFGSEYWLARELQKVLEYKRWDKFNNVINNAKMACKKSNYAYEDHFSQVGKMIELAKEAKRTILDYKLSRYACYLIVQNADPKKEVVALGQTYFAIFQNAGYMGLYGGLDVDDIHTRKQLDVWQKILDYMGSTELIANLFRISQTESKLKRDNVNSESKANQVHYTIGKNIREVIAKNGGTMPEELPTPDKSLKELEKENKKLKIDDCKYNIK